MENAGTCKTGQRIIKKYYFRTFCAVSRIWWIFPACRKTAALIAYAPEYGNTAT